LVIEAQTHSSFVPEQQKLADPADTCSGENCGYLYGSGPSNSRNGNLVESRRLIATFASDLPDRPFAWRGPYVGALCLALILRVAWAVVVPVIPESDCNLYDVWARNIALGNGFSWEAGRPTVFLPVGAPFLYSLCYRFFGLSYTPIVIMNVILGVACVAFTMALARRWFGPSTGFLVGLILAVWPSQIEFVTTLATEPPFIFFMLAAWYIYPDDDSRWLARSVLAGLLFAAASYVRPIAILMPIILVIPIVINRRILIRPIAQASVALLVVGTCLIPWAIRNKRTFGEYALSAHGKLNLWMGNHAGTDGGYTQPPLSTLSMTELERDHYLGAIATDFIRRHPAGFVGRSLVKLVRLHERESIGIVWNQTALKGIFSPSAILALKIFNNLYWWTALALGLGGIVVLVRSDGVIAALFHPAVLVWAYFAVTHAIVVVMDRYHFPCIPCIAALGAFFLVQRFSENARRVALGARVASVRGE
jgi:4-amino-4-deoxy-L-arabinose transferase-like glycosyltransferase